MIVLPLLALTATLLEPNPSGFNRLHPRRVSASSFLQNGWNQMEQNYLPPYAADDDPATAWVEGAVGSGDGESLLWFGPHLQRARAFKVYLRAGYQKSRSLYQKNSRPRRVRLAPFVAQGDQQAPAGAPVEIELADQLGWQEVLVPTAPRVSGLRLTVLSIYPGSVYEDTCLSDLRVYVSGDDPYRPEAEAAAAEVIRRFSAERRRAAEKRGSRPSITWPPAYAARRLLERDLKAPPGERDAGAEAQLRRLPPPSGGVLSGVMPRALEAARLFDVLVKKGAVSVLAPAPWQKVRLVMLPRGDGGARVALAALADLDDGLSERALLLHRKDHAAFAAGAARKGQGGAEISGWVRGDLAGYDAILRESRREVGERETTEETRHDLILFEGDRAAVVFSRWERWEQVTLACHLLRWSDGERPLLREITTLFSQRGQTPFDDEEDGDRRLAVRAYRYIAP